MLRPLSGNSIMRLGDVTDVEFEILPDLRGRFHADVA
jgi:hypothetical protein